MLQMYGMAFVNESNLKLFYLVNLADYFFYILTSKKINDTIHFFLTCALSASRKDLCKIEDKLVRNYDVRIFLVITVHVVYLACKKFSYQEGSFHIHSFLALDANSV